MMKTCAKCKITQPLTGFGKNRQARDQLHYYCRECVRSYRLANLEYYLQKSRSHRQATYDWKKRTTAWREKARIRRSLPEVKSRRNARAAVNLDLKLKKALRERLRKAIKKIGGSHASAVRLLGCGIGEFRSHIESLFTEGMSWHNHGVNGWHLDHILPLSSFDLRDSEQLALACHYKNIQPLWAKDNLEKSDRVPVPAFAGNE